MDETCTYDGTLKLHIFGRVRAPQRGEQSVCKCGEVIVTKPESGFVQIVTRESPSKEGWVL